MVALMTGMMMLTGCDKKEPVGPSLNGDVPRPAWTSPSEYDYTSSMTAVVKVTNLNGQVINDSVVKAEDVLAAFSGETCLGVAEYRDGLFFLFVTATDGDVTLRYWSKHYTNLFEAKDAFPYVNDTQKGTPSAPFTPSFVTK